MGLASARRLAAQRPQGRAARSRRRRRDAAAAAAIDRTGAVAIGIAVDVSDRAAVDAAMAKVRSRARADRDRRHERGLRPSSSRSPTSRPRRWARMIEVNLTGTFHCIQSAIPDMIAAGWGRIVTISSSSAQSGANRMAHYVASKGGVVGLTKALAVEYAPSGITVNTIPPGFIDTPMARRGRSARRPAADRRGRGAHAGAAGGHARRHRRRVRIPLLRRRRLHHRSADRRQRRLVPVSEAAVASARAHPAGAVGRRRPRRAGRRVSRPRS